MVINYFHIFSTCVRPTKTDTPLIVDANAVLTGTITLERFKVISGRHSQIFEPVCDFKLPNLTPRNISNIYESLDTLAF
jgi:hypothetical protein